MQPVRTGGGSLPPRLLPVGGEDSASSRAPKFVTVRRSTLTVIALRESAFVCTPGLRLGARSRPVPLRASVAQIAGVPVFGRCLGRCGRPPRCPCDHRRPRVRLRLWRPATIPRAGRGLHRVCRRDLSDQRAHCQAPRPRDVQRPAHLPVRERHGGVRDGTGHVVGAPPAAREMGTRRDASCSARPGSC